MLSPENVSTLLILALAGVIVALVHYFLTNLQRNDFNHSPIIDPSVAIGVAFVCGLAVILWRVSL